MNSNASTLIGTNPTNPYVQVAPAGFSSLEDMNNEAKALLAAKKDELQQYQQVVSDAEHILSKLNAEIEQKTAELQKLQENEQNDEEGIESQQAEHELAILQQKHQEEI